MTQTPFPALSPAQIDHFLQFGYLVLPDCFSREFAQDWTDGAFTRLGYDPNDRATWEKPIVHMPTAHSGLMSEIAPKAWQAACELLGGEERVAPCYVGDAMIVNFHKGADLPYQMPSPEAKGWHKDGDFFRHFLDSPEQGLLTIVIWSDIEPRGGGTFVACDSVAPVARLLAAHPEGILPNGTPEASFGSLVHECENFIELTGRVGDVVLIHPFILHASSQNHSQKARFITNPPISLLEPMQFDRENPADLSPVERAILRGIGVERLDFQIAAPRERIVSEGQKHKQKLLEEEKARLASQSATN